MIIDPKVPPREFEVGFGAVIRMKDCGTVRLDPDEQLTFLTELGGQYDLARKAWGFYATPSLNSRLSRFGLRAVLVRNRQARYFIMLVEREKEALFEEYVSVESLQIVWWMDSDDTLAQLERAVMNQS